MPPSHSPLAVKRHGRRWQMQNSRRYGQEYTIERETEGHWQQIPFPKNFGFTSVLSTVAAHGSATVYGHIGLLHLTPGHYRLTKQIDGRTLSDDFYIPSTITFPTPVYR